MGSRTGMIFNNAMDDFSTPGQSNHFDLPPSSANFIAPRKMAQSSQSPYLLFDTAGDIRMIGGSAGATTIISANTFVSVFFVNIADV